MVQTEQRPLVDETRIALQAKSTRSGVPKVEHVFEADYHIKQQNVVYYRASAGN